MRERLTACVQRHRKHVVAQQPLTAQGQGCREGGLAGPRIPEQAKGHAVEHHGGGVQHLVAAQGSQQRQHLSDQQPLPAPGLESRSRQGGHGRACGVHQMRPEPGSEDAKASPRGLLDRHRQAAVGVADVAQYSSPGFYLRRIAPIDGRAVWRMPRIACSRRLLAETERHAGQIP